MRRASEFVGEGLVWWASLTGIWLLTLSSVTTAELVAAVAVSLPCAVAAVAARRSLGVDGRIPRHAFRWSLRLPLAVAGDLVAVLALPWRFLIGRTPGDGRWIRVPVAPGADLSAASARTTATLLVSMSPGTFVVHDDIDTGQLMVHALASGPVSMEEVVQR